MFDFSVSIFVGISLSVILVIVVSHIFVCYINNKINSKSNEISKQVSV
jgi:hypothetical protein